jgi:hypothetical protein
LTPYRNGFGLFGNHFFRYALLDNLVEHSLFLVSELRHHERNKIEKTLFLRHEVGFWFIEAKNVVVGVNNIFLL